MVYCVILLHVPIIQAKLTPDIFDAIVDTSAYRAFELETCLLQSVNLTNLNTNQRIVFFTNVFNLAHTHGVISVAKKGGPGINLYERTIFLRSVKYNVAGQVFNLLDVSGYEYIHKYTYIHK